MDWFALSLLAAFGIASADAATKARLADYAPGELVMVRFGLAAVLLLPLLVAQPWPAPAPAFWGWLALLVPLEILAMWLYMEAIRASPLALTLPYLAFTPVFVVVTGQALLGERVSLPGLVGVALVVAGAYVLNLEQGSGWRRWWLPFAAVVRERGSRIMLLVAFLYSLTSVMGKGALAYVSPAFFGPFYFVALGIAAVVVFSLRDRGAVRVLWRRPGANLLVALAMAVMIVAHFEALARVEAAYMIAVKRTSLLFGIAYGALLFGERKVARHLIAGSVMVAGVALIVLG